MSNKTIYSSSPVFVGSGPDSNVRGAETIKQCIKIILKHRGKLLIGMLLSQETNSWN